MSNHTTSVKPIKVGNLLNQTYTVPLYQREYAWGQEEIWQLLDDLWKAFTSAEKNQKRNYHLGSLTVFPRRGSGGGPEYELIDGQQRAITLGLLLRWIRHLCRIFGVPDASLGLAGRLRFENRPEATVFFDAFDASPETPPETPEKYRAAVDAIRNHEVFSMECQGQWKSFAEFVQDHVLLFQVEMPPETDVSAYFEIMNNRGVQLEYHDLLKAKLMAKLNGEKEGILFDKLWGRCADMNGLLLDKLPENIRTVLTQGESWRTLVETNLQFENQESNPNDARSVVNDFPHFLMHVLRRYKVRPGVSTNQEKLNSLDASQIREIFEHELNDIDGDGARDFLDTLLQTRIKFDRLVVKSGAAGNEDGQRWFFADDNGWTSAEHKQLVHLESMLQVTYTAQRSKEWISWILLSDKEDAKGLIELLERFIKKYLHGPMNSWLCSGTSTPHLALNLIDYLMYCDNPQAYLEKPFRFRYANTVEHHFPVELALSGAEKEDWANGRVNDIGNLCLLSKSENSTLNYRPPKDKFALCKGEWETFPPKRREMYRLTQEGDGWTYEVMKKHSKAVCDLLADFLGEEKSSCVSEFELTERDIS